MCDLNEIMRGIQVIIARHMILQCCNLSLATKYGQLLHGTLCATKCINNLLPCTLNLALFVPQLPANRQAQSLLVSRFCHKPKRCLQKREDP